MRNVTAFSPSRPGFLALLAILMLTVPLLASAQTTTGSVRGTVSTPTGNPVGGAVVKVKDTRTSATRTTSTSSDGSFSVGGLAVGGPYEISVTSASYKSALITDVFTNLATVQTFNIELESGALEEVIVTASAEVRVADLAIGPNMSFGEFELENLPAVNRNITDIIRTDPRIYVDESRGDINAVQCGGKNPRYNSLTLDGVRMNDSFGLNSNGYPTERMPFSYDAIREVAVELAPFDVEYGGFTACNINSVTKSGSNQWFGSAFMDYTGDSLRGDSLEGDKLNTHSYDETRYGVNFGGPIIKDKLFFFMAYEKLDGTNLFDRGPQGSGAVNEIEVSQEELDEIYAIARDLYDYDPGFVPSGMDHEDEKILVKLDWNISDNHRFALNYMWNDGENFTQSDSDQNEFEFSNHLYERGAELTSWTGTIWSDWTDNFSTEFRVSDLELDNRQISVGGTDFGEIRVELDDVDVYLGGDDSRQANKLDYDMLTVALKAHYQLDDHLLTFGVEREDLDIFNMFVQHTETEIRFDGIDDFRAGLADAIYYNNAPTNIPEDAAAVWGYKVNTLYAQDEWSVNDRFTLVFGLRYDGYETSSAPLVNQDFVADYGFPNNHTVDGESLVQPRVGFSWDVTDDTTLRGGVGLYSGGNPNVWLSNTYSANNVLQFGQRGRSFGYTDGSRSLFDDDIVWEACESGVPTGPGYCIPGELYDAVAEGVGDNFEINYLDPDFDLPKEWKFALGMTTFFADDYMFTADFLYTRAEDSAMVLHGDLEQTGVNEDGYPQYDSVREPSFVLTNSDRTAESKSLSLGLSKTYDNGFSFTVGYSWNDAEDVQPMTSSVAFSNYINRAFFDPEEDVLSTSNYNIEHRFTFTTVYTWDIAGRFPLTFSLFGQSNTGRPYSRTYNGTIDPYGFTPYLDFEPNVMLPGERRNSRDGSSWSKLDFRINLDLPGFADNHSASVFMVIDNLTNLLNDDWGVLYQHNFPRTIEDGVEESRIGDASRYEIRFGARYSF